MWYTRWISKHIIQRKQIALNVIIHMHYGREWNEIIAQKIYESFGGSSRHPGPVLAYKTV